MTAGIYVIATGEIIKVVDGPPSFVLDQLDEGQDFYLNCPPYATHIINSEPVVITPEPPPPTEAEIIAALQGAVQVMLNKEAQTRSYDGIASLASYAGDEDPVFAAEGAAGKAWRSACWRRCYEILNAVKAGTMPQPTADELVGMMPVMVWPVFG